MLAFQLELDLSPESYQNKLTLTELIGKYSPGAVARRGHDLQPPVLLILSTVLNKDFPK